MSVKHLQLAWIGVVACWLFFVLEITTDFWFGSKFPGYNWMEQSISYLGQKGSPVLHMVRTWGVIFSLLLILFAAGFQLVFNGQKWTGVATALLVIYALAEGIGSAFFSIDPPGTIVMSSDAYLHNLFSSIGDISLGLFPFLLMIIIRNSTGNFYLYLWSTIGIGVLMAVFFGIAKYHQPDNFILYYKGVWQRILLLNYHMMLVIVSIMMLQRLIK